MKARGNVSPAFTPRCGGRGPWLFYRLEPPRPASSRMPAHRRDASDGTMTRPRAWFHSGGLWNEAAGFEDKQ